MKKIITILMLVAVILVGGMTANAKTTRKKHTQKAKSNSSVIGHFKDTELGLTVSLLANGKIKTSSKCWSGSFEKRNQGEYYIVWLGSDGRGNCSDGSVILLIVDNNVYDIDSGSDEYVIWDFIYNSDKNSIIVDIGTMDYNEWVDNNSWKGISSTTIPLSFFHKVGKITWTK